MIRLTAALIALVAAPLAAQAPAPPPTLPRVAIETAAGRIVVEADTARAPLTAGSFLKYVDQKRLDGTAFYRAFTVASAPGFGLIQFGTRNDPKRTLPPIAHEPTSKTGLTHVEGTLSIARGTPGSAAGDFFIAMGEMKSLDADPTQPGDNAGFAAFGRVVEGMDVARRILTAPVSPTEGEGAMKGQMLSPPVRIVTARRLP